MHRKCSRREWLMGTAAAVPGAFLAGSRLGRAAAAPALPVAVAPCKTYDAGELVPTLSRMFDQLGGLGKLVSGKTVGIKINLTGDTTYRLGFAPAEDTHYTHPAVVGAVTHLLSRAGARRIRILECPWGTADPLAEVLYRANWEPLDIVGAGSNVEFENTNYLGFAKKYSRMMVPTGGLMYPGFDLNHSYADCDFFVSIAKLKEHVTAGVTLSMKNCFGMTPATIYGAGAGVDEPSVLPKGGRDLVHLGFRQPSKSAPGEKNPGASRDAGARVPRTVVDLVGARPIHLAIVEGVRTMTGGEGPWIFGGKTASPGVMVAGLNCVNTDAVCMGVMGYDPMADRGTAPFEVCDSTLRLAEDAGLGTRDLRNIEVVGTPIAQVKFDFAEIRKARRRSLGSWGG